MGRTFLLMATWAVAFVAASVTAQNAIRCEVNGKVAYGEACSAGSSPKVIAPTQETTEQKAAGKAATDQNRRDNAYVDKRLDDRYKRETARPAVMEVGTTSAKKRAVRKNNKTVVDAKGEAKRGGVKAKKSKKSKTKATPKAAKKDNRSYRPAPKA